jgi:hypothetical protein
VKKRASRKACLFSLFITCFVLPAAEALRRSQLAGDPAHSEKHRQQAGSYNRGAPQPFSFASRKR